MKKVLSILLVLLLAAAILPTGAFAADVVMSPQNLRVNGKTIECEKYNIDGSNYFKLRDVAYVLNGTGSQFSVNWDGEKRCISLVTGEEYKPNGSELDLSGGDKSASAAPGTDTILVNGEDRTADLTAYKLEGNNFYKLRDLGNALGFHVDYDKPSNTAIIVSHAWSFPTEWLTVETIFNEEGVATSHSVSTYTEEGRLLSSIWEDESASEKSTYVYDELGRQISSTYDYSGVYDGEPYEEHSTSTYYFDQWGLLTKTVYEGTGDVVNESTFTYDDDGNLLVEEILTNAGRYGYYHTYDDNGNEIKYVSTLDDEVLSTDEYERDADGNIIVSRTIEGDGNVYSTNERTYVDGLLTEIRYVSGDYQSSTRYTYDENGNMIRSETVDDYGTSSSAYIYDSEGRVVQEEYTYGDFSNVTVYTYNEQGLRTKMEGSSSDGSYYEDTVVYDEAGNPLSEVYRNGGFTRTDTYTYDLAAHKQTVLVVYEYEGVG